MSERIDPHGWTTVSAGTHPQNEPDDIPLINTELEFLRDFFDAWESFQVIASSDCHRDKKQLAAQNLVNAATCVRNWRKPNNLLQPEENG